MLYLKNINKYLFCCNRMIVLSQDFQHSILQQCLSLGAHLISSSEKYSTARSDDPFLGVTESPGNALYRAAQGTLLQHLTDFMTLLPRTPKHQNRLHKIFTEDSFSELLFFLVPATCCYLNTLDYLPGKSIPNDSLEDIALLSIVCCEVSIFLLISPSFCFIFTNMFMDFTVFCRL